MLQRLCEQRDCILQPDRFRDRFGSTRKIATSTGTLHSQQLYKAWGESRYTSGTLPTRYTYTGQYSYASDFGLVFYGARFYDPLLSRWASPDSIIPQNQGTLAWDRYAYSYGNPVKYIDPSGHKPCEGENDAEGCDWKLPALLKKADALLQKNIGVDDLKAMAGIVDFAHRLYGRDWDGMAKSLSLLFLGDQVRGPGSLWTTYRSPHGPVIDFKDTGFHPDFRDYRNQVYHTWAYIVETASPNNIAEGILGGYSATVGNYVHEFPLADGSSWEDFQLAEAGIYIGWQVTTGAVSLSQLGDFILQTLGPNAPPGLTSAGRLPYSPLESWLLQDVSK